MRRKRGFCDACCYCYSSQIEGTHTDLSPFLQLYYSESAGSTTASPHWFTSIVTGETTQPTCSSVYGGLPGKAIVGKGATMVLAADAEHGLVIETLVADLSVLSSTISKMSAGAQEQMLQGMILAHKLLDSSPLTPGGCNGARQYWWNQQTGTLSLRGLDMAVIRAQHMDVRLSHLEVMEDAQLLGLENAHVHRVIDFGGEVLTAEVMQILSAKTWASAVATVSPALLSRMAQLAVRAHDGGL